MLLFFLATEHRKARNLKPPFEALLYNATFFILLSENEFVNVQDLGLKNGKRYRVCIHANETTKQYEKWSETLPEISKCTDGVIVDTLPPATGTVWVESTKKV